MLAPVGRVPPRSVSTMSVMSASANPYTSLISCFMFLASLTQPFSAALVPGKSSSHK